MANGTSNGNGNGKTDWKWLAVVSLQAILLALGGWNLKTTADHGNAIAAINEWKGAQPAYQPSDAAEDQAQTEKEIGRIINILEKHSDRMDDHDRRLRALEIKVAKITN
jgi:hypothetical protein